MCIRDRWHIFNSLANNSFSYLYIQQKRRYYEKREKYYNSCEWTVNKIKKIEIIANKKDKENMKLLLKKNDYITKAEKFISEGPCQEINYDYKKHVPS